MTHIMISSDLIYNQTYYHQYIGNISVLSENNLHEKMSKNEMKSSQFEEYKVSLADDQ